MRKSKLLELHIFALSAVSGPAMGSRPGDLGVEPEQLPPLLQLVAVHLRAAAAEGADLPAAVGRPRRCVPGSPARLRQKQAEGRGQSAEGRPHRRGQSRRELQQRRQGQSGEQPAPALGRQEGAEHGGERTGHTQVLAPLPRVELYVPRPYDEREGGRTPDPSMMMY